MPVADDMERLHALHARGALSDAEFAQAKAQVLGGPAADAGPGTARPTFLHRLTRSATDRVLGGVCGGLGAHTDLPAWGWRVIFCIAVLYFGIGLLLYLLLWIFIPAAPAAAPTPPGR